MTGKGFQEATRRALGDNFLQTALLRATASFKGMRTAAEADFPDFQDMRLRARAAKDRALNDLETHLTRLEKSILDRGGQVFWAEDEAQVIGYITELAHKQGARLAVKGKSMTTEEIHLNPALEAAGVEVWETDLGEYILQLLGERPSHIIGPAIHKTKEEIGRLFAEKIGLDYTDDPEVMTRAVRRELRTRFLAADIGISGVNMASAESGTLVLLENEGNIRMSTTLPRIHVAIMGLDKVVADQADLSALLRILPLAAVGQRLPSYVSFLTGPGRSRGEGPEELHLIFYDGYRTRLLGDPLFRQALRCMRCGACLNYCPVYRRLGGHRYPWVYSGPIGVVLTGAVLGPEAARDIIGASTLCRVCAEVCPVMIELPDLILELRRRLAAKTPVAGDAARLAARFMAAPWGYDLTGRLLGVGAETLMDGTGRIRLGPENIREMAQGRRLPRPASEPFHRQFFKGDEE